jgi:hypothetical protein
MGMKGSRAMTDKHKTSSKDPSSGIHGTSNLPPCPYCSQWQRFRGVLTGEPGRLEENAAFYVGKFWNSNIRYLTSATYEVFSDHYRMQAGGRQFIKRFSDFSLTLIGFRYTFEESKLLEIWRAINLNSSPFFAYIESQIVNPEKPYVFFSICRITHKKSGVIFDGHVWPTHGLIVTGSNFIGGTLSSTEVKISNEALEFFRMETRGGGQKIEEIAVIVAVRQLGTKATQANVARKLKVSLVTLQRWVARKGKGWEELKSEYLRTGADAGENLIYAPPLSLISLRNMAEDPNVPAARREAAQHAVEAVEKIFEDAS